MNLSKVLFGLVSCVFAASLTGCVVVHDDPPPPAVYHGSITVDYTIHGSDQPLMCAIQDADQLEVTVIDSAGFVAASATARCESFGMTIDELPEGRYEVDATLLDVDGYAVSDTLVFPDADVIADSDLRIDTDFSGDVLH